MRPGALVVSVVFVAGTTISAAPDAGASEKGWGPVQTVTRQTFSWDPPDRDVAARPAGSVIAAWIHQSSAVGGLAVHVRERTRSGTWGTRHVVSGALPDRYAPLDLAAGPGRSASVVWADDVDGERSVLESHPGHHGWSPPHVVGAGKTPAVTVDGRGTTTVAWNDHGLVTARRPAGGRWTAPHRLTAQWAGNIDLASNAHGRVVAAWNASGGNLQSVVGGPAGWGTVGTRMRVRDLESDSWLGPPFAEMGPAGRALVVWSTGEFSKRVGDWTSGVVWSRSHRGGWSRAAYLARDVGESGQLLDVTVNERGQGLVVWRANIFGGDNAQGRLEARGLHLDGTWGPLGKLTRSVGIGAARAYVDPSGTAHVVASMTRLTAFRQPPGGDWGNGIPISRGTLADGASAGRRMTVLISRRHLLSRTLQAG